MARRCCLLVLVFVWCGLAERALAKDDYGTAMERAGALERAGRLAEAAAMLESIEADFPQDFTLQIRIGWLHLFAGQYQRATLHYRRALKLSPRSLDAQNGLAWSLLRAGKVVEARSRFRAVLARSPKNAVARRGLGVVRLHLGWLDFQAGKYQRAVAQYRGALKLSPKSLDAKSGLAWSLLRAGKAAEARSEFRALLARSPENTIARRGLALSSSDKAAPFSLSPSLFSSFLYFQDHSFKTWGMTATVSLPVRFRLRLGPFEHGVLSATYRHGHYWVSDWPLAVDPELVKQMLETSGVTLAWSDEDFRQDEIYLSAGLDSPELGVFGHYASLNDGSWYLKYSQVVGLSVRYRPPFSLSGDVRLESSVSFYPDMDVVRVSPSWRLYPLRWLSVTPEMAVQVAAAAKWPHKALDDETEVLVTGMLTVAAFNKLGTVSVGGKYGDEVRPAYFDLSVVYNHADRTAYGGWATGQLRLGRGWSLFLCYELERLESNAERTGNNLHIFTVGANWSSIGVR